MTCDVLHVEGSKKLFCVVLHADVKMKNFMSKRTKTVHKCMKTNRIATFIADEATLRKATNSRTAMDFIFH
ncbi:unnamed protein product [Urochloa humidicola]